MYHKDTRCANIVLYTGCAKLKPEGKVKPTSSSFFDLINDTDLQKITKTVVVYTRTLEPNFSFSNVY